MYIDLIFYKFTSNLARQLLIKVISVFGEKRTVYMRRFHTIITKYEYAPNAIYVLHWEQIAEYFEIIVFLLQNFPAVYIFYFLWSDQVMYNCFIYT